MADEFTGQQRAARAFESYLAGQAKDAEFPALDPATLVGRPTPRRRWRPVLIAAAAALAVVAAGIGIHRAVSGGIPAVPIAPVEKSAWQRTSSVPIGQRYGSVNLWADGAFYVIGGHRHCGLDDQGRRDLIGGACPASLPSSGGPLADGARYDPATDSWQRIADAPVAIGHGQGVVVGGRLYLSAEPGWGDAGEQLPTAVLEYDPASDTWTELARPEGSLEVVQLLSWRDGLYATVTEPGCLDVGCAHSIQRWDPAAAAWRPFAPSHPAIGHGLIAATRDGFAAVTDTTVAVFSDDQWVDLDPKPALPLSAAGQLLWASGDLRGNLVTVLTWDGRAHVLRLDEPAWESATASAQAPGGLSAADDLGTPRFSDGSHVVVDGRLYDPVATTWTDIPALPNPEWSFGAFASSGSQVLACYVGPANSFNDCYLLTLDEPTAAQPPATVGGWRTVAAPPLAPRGEAIATWIGQEYLVVGGSVCTGEASADPENGELDCTMTAALDGAAYDPATDRWRTIAAPPAILRDGQGWAVLQDTLYAISTEPEGLWSYHLATDSWQELPPPPGGLLGDGGTIGLIALNDVLLALAGPSHPDSWFDPATGAWTELSAGTYPNGVYPDHAARQVVFTGKELLVGEPDLGDGDSRILRVSVFELDPDGRLATTPSAESLRPVPAGRLAVDGSGTVTTLPAEGGKTFHRTGGGGEWLPVPESGHPDGALRSGVVAGDAVALDGNLFSPRTGSWRSVGLPSGLAAGGFVQAGGPDAVLFCFGLTDAGDLTDSCHLLPV